MRTYYYFHSESSPELHAFTDDRTGDKLPEGDKPWTFVREISPDGEWTHGASRAVVVAGIAENGFSLWGEGAAEHPHSSKPIVESDRVEGTAVFGESGNQVGTIKRLLIEKVSGRVIYVDVTFGGFLGLGAHHHTIPWDKLTYDTRLHGYRTDITEEQVRGAPTFDRADEMSTDRTLHDFWRTRPGGQ
jgi:hypothetical protein